MSLNSFYFVRVQWSWKNWFWTVSSLGGCGGHERIDFEQFLVWEGVVVLKKKWVWTVSTLGGCGGLERTYGRYTGRHWGHTRGCLNIWECWGHQGTSGVSECMGASKHMGSVKMPPNIWGCQLNVPKCKTYMPLKKIRGVWTYGGVEMHREALGTYKGVFKHMGVLGALGGVQMHGASKHMGVSRCPKHMGVSSQCPQVQKLHATKEK